jgi:hypothetical protein
MWLFEDIIRGNDAKTVFEEIIRGQNSRKLFEENIRGNDFRGNPFEEKTFEKMNVTPFISVKCHPTWKKNDRERLR